MIHLLSLLSEAILLCLLGQYFALLSLVLFLFAAFDPLSLCQRRDAAIRIVAVVASAGVVLFAPASLLFSLRDIIVFLFYVSGC